MMKREDYNEELQVLLDEFWREPYSITPLGQARAERIFNQIMASSQVNEKVQSHISGKRIWLKAVAAVLIIISISALLYKLEFQSSDSRRTSVVKNNNLVKPDNPGRRFINLPDGSSVILNENSRLEFGGFNANGKREVYLEGEAYFDIKQDASRPFIVYTGKLQTTVLGTAFNINSNSQNGTITVTVTRGKVKVGDKTHTFHMIDPDEQVVFDKDLTQHVKKSVKAETFIAWKNEDIYFDDVNICQQDILYFGGMIRSMRVARMAAEFGKVIAPHITNNGLGYIYMLQLISACPNADKYQEFQLFTTKDANGNEIPIESKTKPIISEDGVIAVPTGSGLGIVIDPDYVKKHKVVKDW